MTGHRRIFFACSSLLLVLSAHCATHPGSIQSTVALATGQAAGPRPVAVPDTQTPAVLSPWKLGVAAQIRHLEYHFSPAGDGAWSAPNRAQGFRSRFSPDGVEITPRGRLEGQARALPWRLQLRLSGFGREGALHPPEPAAPWVAQNRVEYRRGELTEWYLNDERGIEQGFLIERPPAPAGPDDPVVLEMAVEGSLHPRPGEDRRSVEFLAQEEVRALRYADLKVFDARGQEVAAETLYADGRLRLSIHDAGAVYPLLVDPLVTSPSWGYESNQSIAHLGISVAPAGDVNGDRFADVIVGAAWFDNGQTDEGRAFVFHGSPSGFPFIPNWTAESNQAFAFFGFAVASAGDVNGDGYDDVIVGADDYDAGQTNEGRVFVYHGSATGLSTTANWTAESNQVNSGFGFSVASAGDVNGDGYDDVIVGADLFDSGQTDEGKAFVYHGSPTGLATTAAWTAEGNQVEASFGWSVASAGDVNGDGYDDVIIGAVLYDNGQTDEGRAYVYHGSATGLMLTPAWITESNQVEAFFGYSVAGAGDVNKDGYDDVLVGATFYDNGQTNEGRVFSYRGSATGLSTTASWTRESNQANARYGNSVASAGDVNGDGYSDVIIGSPLFDNGESNEGRAFVYLGSATGLLTTLAWNTEGNQVDAWFSWAVASAGDVNRDGRSDVIVGTPNYTSGQFEEGAAYLFLGSGPCVDSDGDGFGAPGGTSCSGGALLDCDDTDASVFPGAAESCNGLDNNCDGVVDNPPLPAGTPSVTTMTPPSGGVTTMSWTTLPGATGYDVVRGDLATLRNTGGDFSLATNECVANDIAATSMPVSTTLTPGQGSWILVRGVNCRGSGTYNVGGSQVGSRDAEINSSPHSCPP